MDEKQLLEFLYLAPVGLIKFDSDGVMKMANPRVAQLFNRYRPGGYFENFLDLLEDVSPEAAQKIKSFSEQHGQVLDSERFRIEAPSGSTDDETMWLDFTVVKIDADMFICSMTNVTAQVTATENESQQQETSKLRNPQTNHILFTCSTDNKIDSWNKTGETYLTDESSALGKHAAEVLDMDAGDFEMLCSTCCNAGPQEREMNIVTSDGKSREATLNVSPIINFNEECHGFAVVVSLSHTTLQYRK